MISLKNISVLFSKGTPLEKIVINNLSLNIKEGEFISVIGSNGAGKTTLLNAISGDYKLQSGEIYIDNKLMNNYKTYQRAYLVSRVFQDPLAGTCEDLSIEENFALALMRGEKRTLFPAINEEKRRYFKEKLKVLNLGLENRLQDKVALLSGGQRQALSLLMSASNSMKIFLLDEHTAALDPKTAKFILNLTQKIIKEKNLTSFMVTHSMQQALDYGNRLIMLHEGKIICDVSDEQKQKLSINDLLQMFHDKNSISDDILLN